MRYVSWKRLARYAAIGVYLVCPAVLASTYYESAADLYASGNFTGAEVELRNALQESAENVPARVLLGQVLLELDDPRAAAAELEEGLALGGDQNLILVPLAEVYLQLLQPEKVLTSIIPPGTDPRIDGEIMLLHGDAALLLGDLASASRSYADARALLPGDARPLVGEARVAGARRRDAAAENLIDEALALDPANAAALTLRGLRRRDAGDPEAARDAFDRALESDPASVKALGARAALLLNTGEEAAAVVDIERLRELNPRDLEGVYLQSWLYISRGDADAAQSLLAETAGLLEAVDEERLKKLPQARLLLGIVSFLNREYELAVEHFTTFLARFPRHGGARRYLAATYLGAGDWENVVKTLEPDPGAPPLDNPSSLALLAEALRARGDHERAARYYARALKIAPDQVGFALGLAASRFAAGKTDDAIESMEALTAETPGFIEARVKLVGMYVDAGRATAATEAAEALLRERPDDAAAHNLLGVVMMTRGSRDEALANFTRAQELDPSDSRPVLNQARLARLSDNLGVAQFKYRAVLERDPNATDARLELAQVLLARGDIDAAAETIGPLLEREPNNIGARLVQLWLSVANGDSETIEDAMYRLQRDFPESAVALLGLARVSLTLGDVANAKLMLRRASKNAGFHPDRQVEIASLHLESGDLGAASLALTKALDGNPRHLGALSMRVSVLLAKGKVADAKTAYEVLAAAYPERAETLIAQGDLHKAAGDSEGAVRAYAAAHAIGANRQTLERLFEAQINMGDERAALTTIRIWILRHPGDLASRHQLGESLLDVGAYRSAKLVYEELIKDEPGNPVSLNNLAYALQRLGDERALALAQQAVAAAPEQADFLDTYGWILVETGDAERGLEVLRDAYTRQSTNEEIRYHIALALVALERPDAARRELDAAIASGRAFPSRSEAVGLRKQLGTL